MAPDAESGSSAPRVVRPATPEDASALVLLYRRAYGALSTRGFPSAAAAVGRREVDDWLREREVLVAGDVTGAVQLRRHPEWDPPEVSRLAVDPDRRGEGIGDRLRRHAEARAGDRGHAAVRLRAFSDHPFLVEWYRDRGYREVGVQRLDERPYDAVVMEKELQRGRSRARPVARGARGGRGVRSRRGRTGRTADR